ncbi:MAG: hypothetical protein R2704_11635 [Microthrixaceae bacterium]
MEARRWTNRSLPQTLQIANILLYIDAFFLVIGIVFGPKGFGAVAGALLALSVAGYLIGGLGLANEEKRGYIVAILASFSPFILRAFDAFAASEFALIYILGLRSPLNLLFEAALIALLLHTQSQSYVSTWFK